MTFFVMIHVYHCIDDFLCDDTCISLIIFNDCCKINSLVLGIFHKIMTSLVGHSIYLYENFYANLGSTLMLTSWSCAFCNFFGLGQLMGNMFGMEYERRCRKIKKNKGYAMLTLTSRNFAKFYCCDISPSRYGQTNFGLNDFIALKLISKIKQSV